MIFIVVNKICDVFDRFVDFIKQCDMFIVDFEYKFYFIEEVFMLSVEVWYVSYMNFYRLD